MLILNLIEAYSLKLFFFFVWWMKNTKAKHLLQSGNSAVFNRRGLINSLERSVSEKYDWSNVDKTGTGLILKQCWVRSQCPTPPLLKDLILGNVVFICFIWCTDEEMVFADVCCTEVPGANISAWDWRHRRLCAHDHPYAFWIIILGLFLKNCKFSSIASQ